MKKFMIIALILTSTLSFAQESELVLESNCGMAKLDHRQIVTYKSGARAEDTRVKAVLTLSESGIDETYYSEVVTNIIPSLEKSATEIIHVPTGTVCAQFKKPGLIGRKMWIATKNCFYTSNEVRVVLPDADDFGTIGKCTRQYFLNVR